MHSCTLKTKNESSAEGCSSEIRPWDSMYCIISYKTLRKHISNNKKIDFVNAFCLWGDVKRFLIIIDFVSHIQTSENRNVLRMLLFSLVFIAFTELIKYLKVRIKTTLQEKTNGKLLKLNHRENSTGISVSYKLPYTF